MVDAWVSLVNLVNKSYLKSFYSHDDEEVRCPAACISVEQAETDSLRLQCEAYFRIFDTLLADSMPKIYESELS